MGQDGKDRKGRSVDPANPEVAVAAASFVNPLAQANNAESLVPVDQDEGKSDFERLLAQDREYEKSVSRRMIVTWLSVAVLILLWWIASRIFGVG